MPALPPSIQTLLHETAKWTTHYNATGNALEAWAHCDGSTIQTTLTHLFGTTSSKFNSDSTSTTRLNPRGRPSVHVRSLPITFVRPMESLERKGHVTLFGNWLLERDAEGILHAAHLSRMVDAMAKERLPPIQAQLQPSHSLRLSEVIGLLALEQHWNFEDAPEELGRSWFVHTLMNHEPNMDGNYIVDVAMQHPWAWSATLFMRMHTDLATMPHLDPLWTRCPHPPVMDMLFPMVRVSMVNGTNALDTMQADAWASKMQAIHPEWMEKAQYLNHAITELYGPPRTWPEVTERAKLLWIATQGQGLDDTSVLPDMVL